MSRMQNSSSSRIIGVWEGDDKEIRYDELMIQGDEIEEVVNRILDLSTGSGYIELFTVSPHDNVEKSLKKIRIEQSLELI